MWVVQQNAGCKVVGQTNTTNHHEELQALGIHPITKDEGATDKYPFVVFSAPPHGSENYITEVRFVYESFPTHHLLPLLLWDLSITCLRVCFD
jgi:hypothetical protein